MLVKVPAGGSNLIFEVKTPLINYISYIISIFTLVLLITFVFYPKYFLHFASSIKKHLSETRDKIRKNWDKDEGI